MSPDSDRSVGSTPSATSEKQSNGEPRPVVDAVSIVGSPGGAFDPSRAQTIERFARRVRRLPTFSQVFRGYQRSIDGADERLRRSARLLNGRFVVANAPVSVVLPVEVREQLITAAASFARISPGSTVELRLEEPTDFSIRHSAGGISVGSRPESKMFEATIDYRLLLVVRPPSDADRASLVAECEVVAEEAGDRLPWFRIALCIPDHHALQRMSPEAAHFYRWITGRMGRASKDEYWDLDAWDQYTEPGRTAGIVVPDFLRLPLHAVRPVVDSSAPGALDSPVYGKSAWPALTGNVARGVLVPPGFCFIEFEGTISMCTTIADPAPPRSRQRS